MVVLITIGSIFAYTRYIKRGEMPESSNAAVSQASETQQVTSPAVRSLPVRLIISRINVDSMIEFTGVTSDGNMAVPSDISVTGWYKLGTLPGNKGSAVMSGHVTGKGGRPGVFAKLDSLRAGDLIETIDMNGLKSVFTVQYTKQYPRDDQPDEVFHSSEGTHLNLITCVGDWNESERQFSDRLVVFADML